MANHSLSLRHFPGFYIATSDLKAGRPGRYFSVITTSSTHNDHFNILQHCKLVAICQAELKDSTTPVLGTARRLTNNTLQAASSHLQHIKATQLTCTCKWVQHSCLFMSKLQSWLADLQISSNAPTLSVSLLVKDSKVSGRFMRFYCTAIMTSNDNRIYLT